jgi:4-amino-4-deoxy-L-arabinose transferase-like glycosyltransferase
MVEGQGPQTVFGGYFLPHAPVWSTLIVAPAVALGIDPLVVGRLFNALSGVGLILLSAALGWRIRPAAGALAAIGLLATAYIHELTRTSRLDIPSATLAVAYLALGLIAVRRGSTRYSVAAGLLFGVAFLVKEIALPLAPVPILAAVLHRQPWRPILRSAGWLTLSATVAVAPWFVYVAQMTDRVYRLGTPGWTLGPIGLALLLVGLAAVLGSRLEMPSAGQELADRLEGRGRTWLVAGLTAIWVAGLTLVFTGTLTTRGTGLIDLPQIARYVREWYPILVTSGIGAVGLVLSILGRRDPALGRREALEDLWLATICGLPLVILVIGVGEAPRNYLAQLAIGAGIAAAGWLWLFEAAMRRRPTFTVLAVGAMFGLVLGMVFADAFGVRVRIGAIGGLVGGVLVAGVAAAALRGGRPGSRTEPAIREHALAGLLAVSLICATGALVDTIDFRRTVATREEAVDTVVAWARDHVEGGSTIAFGSYLGFEMGLALRDDFTLRQVRHVLAVADADAPDGVTMFGRPASDDWVSIDIAPKNVNEFQAFSASMFVDQLRQTGADYWVYTTGTSTAAPTIIPALEGAEGFERVAHWTFDRPRGAPIETSIYKLDPDRLALETDRIHMAPDALERMVAFVEREDAAPLAGRLVAQVEVDPPSDASEALMDRLRSIAAAAVDP